MSDNDKNGTSTRSVGRPTDYTPEIANKICELIAQGHSLNKLSQRDDIPSSAAIYNWLARYPEFVEKYAHARGVQAEVMAQEIQDLADDCDLERNAINKARLQVDSRKWLMSKLYPNKYGDSSKQQIEVSGEVHHAHVHSHHVNIPQRVSVNEWLQLKQEQQAIECVPQKQDTITDKFSCQPSTSDDLEEN